MLVALYRPEIPQNCGNISRSCCATGTELILIPPLGFYMHDKFVQRSGMDYIHNTKISICNMKEEEWFEQHKDICWLFTSEGSIRYDHVDFTNNDILLFGCESKGLPKEWIDRMQHRTCYIPMTKGTRSLNLATSVGIALYEAHKRSKSHLFHL